MAGLTTRMATDEAGLAALADPWRALWRACPAATPFQSPDWLIPWWAAFHPGQLRTAAVFDGEALVALAPLYLETGPLGRRLLPVGIGISDYLDLLVHPARPDAGAALAGAIGALDDWEILSLEELAPGAAALALPAPPGALDAGTEAQTACPVLALPGGPDPFRAAVPSDKRRHVRLAYNRAARREGFRLEAVAPADIPGFLEDLYRLHGARWRERGEPGVLDDPAVRAFHAGAAPALAAAGLARFSRMWIEGEAVAAFYGLSDGRRAYAYLIGFDPDFAFESPGVVVVAEAIQAAAAEGLCEFHFLRGQEPYKYQWGPVDRWSVRRTLTREPVHA